MSFVASHTLKTITANLHNVFLHRNKLPALTFLLTHKSLHRAALVQQMPQMQNLVGSDVEIPETSVKDTTPIIRLHYCKNTLNNNWNKDTFY